MDLWNRWAIFYLECQILILCFCLKHGLSSVNLILSRTLNQHVISKNNSFVVFNKCDEYSHGRRYGGLAIISSLTSSTCVHDLNGQLQDDKICMQQSPVQCHYDIPQVKTSDFPLLPNLIIYSPDLKLDVT